ncbi:MAG: type II toxin-antitoxin system VapC family toxin [Acidiferrobacteraceae bacterium]
MKLLLDTNVLLDVLARREPHWEASARVLSRIEAGDAQGLIAAHGVTTVHYLLSRHLTRKKADVAISQLLDLLQVAPLDHGIMLRALALNWRDFEDAVQAAAALGAKATHLITRNPRDFAALGIPVLTPEEFLRKA